MPDTAPGDDLVISRQRTVRAAVLLAATALSISLLSIGEASAGSPPSPCGVRLAGPDFGPSVLPIGLNGLYSYTVQNQCGYTTDLTAAIYGRPNFCSQFFPGQVRSFNSAGNDLNWTVVAC